ncbi:MAG: hypothetical protein IOD09_10945 [Rhodocyclaceae bacterium]|jgi:hypothetical protein|nr:hypothetical protein [Rhodocyclaceae bacterium]
MTPLTPDAVMAQIAAALPEDCRPNVIVIGSLWRPATTFSRAMVSEAFAQRMSTACSRLLRKPLRLLGK